MEILKIVAIVLMVMFTLFSARRLAVNFNAWRYEREHIKYLRTREECRREQERNKHRADDNNWQHLRQPRAIGGGINDT